MIKYKISTSVNGTEIYLFIKTFISFPFSIQNSRQLTT